MRPVLSLKLPISAFGLALFLGGCTQSYGVKAPSFKGKPYAEKDAKDGDLNGDDQVPGDDVTDPGTPPEDGMNPSDPGDDTPMAPLSIRVTEEAPLALGLKAAKDCDDVTGAKASGLGVYVNFEVLEDDTSIALHLDRLCGDLTQASAVSLIDADGKIQKNALLGSKEINEKTEVLSQESLKKGSYTLAIEAGGSTVETLSSLLIDGAVLEGSKGITLKSVSEF